ncbi:protein SHORTAGE IN CHIASMATA 1 isoform X1 [Cucurbita pepo subsp. pepo]|uniref:protein SHORTAGE IN CHIASMATA 1 isoform X1 n=1 Tax=Cucurbita pepo subsp. pepo TaxID=3664 RepID=UPI000C9D90DE|nr:protein SHORTAGE IN CHIASMATA 1 isoform X1 [Cucurbita pepo subsp. pepo]
MRTRFLNIDFFAPGNESFHRLPVPHLVSNPLSTVGDLLHFDFLPEISLGIDSLSIDSAISRFFDDVLPRRIEDDDVYRDAGCQSSGFHGSAERIFSSGSVGTRLREQEAKGTYEDNMEGSWKNFGSETSEMEFIKKDIGTEIRNRNFSNDMIQFETPQLDAFLENAFLFEKEEVQILTGMPEVEFDLETLNQGLLKYPSEVKESIYDVEIIPSEYLLDQESCLFEDDFAQDQKLSHQFTFPFLEVDEMVLETLAFLSLQDELFFILENTESAHMIQDDNLLVNNEEYLSSMRCDAEEFLSDHFLRPCAVSELASPDISGGLSDLMSMMETLEIAVSSEVQTKSSCDLSVEPAIFEEFQLLDTYSNQHFGVILDLEVSAMSEITDCTSIENTNFKSFNELIVCHELVLVDDTFKSLPVPILSSQGSEKPLNAFIEDVLANLNKQSLSASDGIYLDWHLLDESSYSSGLYSSYQNMLEEINLKPVEFDQEPCENDGIFYRYVFSDDALVRERTEDKGELKESFPEGIPMLSGQTIDVASSKLLNERCQQKERQGLAAVGNSEKALSSWKSKSESNDLKFFLNSQKPARVRKSESVFSEIDTNTTLPKVPRDGILTNKPSMSSADDSLKQLNVAVHQVCLSDNILHLINNSEKTYLAILQNETELRKKYLPYVAEDYLLMLSLPKQMLIDCIKKIYLQGTNTYWEEKIMTLATLYATKQIVWYLCFYGIHPAHLYLKKLCQSSECLKSRLGFLVSSIEEAGKMVGREITISHPALTTIQEILCSRTSISSLKVLVVANQIFWWSLKKLLGSLGISFAELNYGSLTDEQVSNANAMVDDLASNCLLVSEEYISGSFPFNKFSIVLEYGGLNGSSQISAYFSNLIDMPHLHFIMLELDKCGNCKAFCEGVDFPQHNELTIEEKSLVENQTMMLEKLLNFLPVEEKYILASPKKTIEAENRRVSLRAPVVPVSDKSQHTDLVSFPEAIIIVNTQKFEKEMIVCRRSSYQRILALEKEGVQVVERDLCLPVDLIIAPGICLFWYDCTNIDRKGSTSNEASLSLNLCIENIATDVLTSLSFAFRGCVLISFQVFEGEISSLSIVMESSDGLYAAAASLEIDFQLFCSYSSELTDEIILGCIENVSKLMTRRIYPKMSESETLAESFLTSFPSINPLIAHGILSSESLLADFLEWPHERRLHAIRKYSIPDDCISLFSALCKYGEREDSKSVMTDCSSSLSSGADSEKCHFNGNSERKRRNFTGGSQCIEKNTDCLYSNTLNPFTAGTAETLVASKSFGSQLFEDPEIFCDLKGLSSSVNNFFDQNHNLASFDATVSMDPTRVCKPRDCWISTAPEISDEIRRHCSSFVQNQGLDRSKKKIHNFHNMNKSENHHEELIAEVDNLIDNPVLKDHFATMAPMNFLPSMLENETDSSRKSKIQRRLSYGQSDHPFCAVDVGNNSSSDFWSSINLHGQSSRGLDNQFPDPSFEPSIMPLRYKDDHLDEGLTQNPLRDSKVSFSLSEKHTSHSDVTPLSVALRSKHLQESSPWTMEFLNRIREKSRNRQHSVPRGSSSPFPENLGNVKKTVKRRSPSILEFFKYQGGSTLRKKPEQKRHKPSTQSSNSSKNVLVATRELSSGTPIDKRSRQTLSYATDGNGSQTKLVWSNDNYGLGKNSQKLGNK